jgi:hypothetical protein
MKIKVSKKVPRKLKQAGNALLVALVLGSILCVSVVGYLTVTEQQNFLCMRSQVWNTTITVVEAGIEEGIQHMDYYPTQPAQDGWQQSGIWYYHTSTLPSGDSYTVYANNTNIWQPVIVCKATVTSPTLFTRASSPFMFAAYGGPSVTNAVAPTVTRAVKVQAKRSSLFTKAMVAKHAIAMGGNGMLVNSFDSGNWNYSNFGQYDPTKARSNGDVASNDTISGAVNAGNANIYGHVETGPNGSITLGPNGGVGSYAYQASNPGSTQPGWTSHDSNFTFPDTALAYTSGIGPLPAADIPISTMNVSSNYVPGSTTYPNPVPWSGVQTNCLNYVNNPTWPGPSVPCVVTNMQAVSGTTVYPPPGTYIGSISTNYINGPTVLNAASLPPVGQYIPGTQVQRPNGNWNYTPFYGYDYSYTQLTGYQYATQITYNYATYGTNYSTNVVHYDMVLNSGDYYLDSWPGGSLYVGGTARLVIANGLTMSGQDQITIGNNGSLTLYSGGTANSVGGNGVANQAGLAQNFIMYCAPTVKTLSFTGNGNFIGVICAPTADITMNGGGNNNNDFEGALIGNSVTMNGHFSFHYDEALSRLQNIGRLLVTAWDEIDPLSSPTGP